MYLRSASSLLVLLLLVGWSASAVDTTPPDAPTWATAPTPIGTSGIYGLIDWTEDELSPPIYLKIDNVEETDGCGPDYEIPSAAYRAAFPTLGPPTNPAVLYDLGITANTTCTYNVTAIDTQGNESTVLGPTGATTESGLPVDEEDTGFLSAHCIDLCGDLGVGDGSGAEGADGIPDFTILAPDGTGSCTGAVELNSGDSISCAVTAPICITDTAISSTVSLECVYVSGCRSGSTGACIDILDGWTDSTGAARAIEADWITVLPNGWEYGGGNTEPTTIDGSYGHGIVNRKAIDPDEVRFTHLKEKHVGRAMHGPMSIQDAWFEAACSDGSTSHTEWSISRFGNRNWIERAVFKSYYSDQGICVASSTGTAQIFYDSPGSTPGVIKYTDIYIDADSPLSDFGPVFLMDNGTYSSDVTIQNVEVINYDNSFISSSFTCGGTWTWSGNTLNGSTVGNPCP